MKEITTIVLTRKPGESIIINDNIEVHVSKVKGNQVRIAVKAPRDIKIWREEIYKKIKGDLNE